MTLCYVKDALPDRGTARWAQPSTQDLWDTSLISVTSPTQCSGESVGRALTTRPTAASLLAWRVLMQIQAGVVPTLRSHVQGWKN